MLSKIVVLKVFLTILLLFLFIQLIAAQPAFAESTIKVGVYNFEPMIFIAPDGTPKGLYIDVLSHIAAKENWKLEFVPGTWAECLERVKKGQIDLQPSIGYTDERARDLDFSQNYLFLDWGLVYRRKGQAIETVLDLEGKTVAVLKGSVYTLGFGQLLEQFAHKARMVEKKEYTEVLEAVDRGEVEAGIITKVYGLVLEGRYRNIEATTIYFSPVKLRFAVPKGKNTPILTALESHLTALKADKDSPYYESLDKWMGFYKHRTRFPAWLPWGLAGLGGLLLFFLGTSLVFRQKVKEKTHSLEEANRELQKSELSLRESEEQYRAFFENSMDAIFLTQPDGAILAANTEASRIFGRTEEELKQAGRAAVVDSSDPRLVPALEERRRTGRFKGELTFLRADGTRFPGEISSSIFKDRLGQEKTVMIISDITERKLAEDKLHLSEERFSNAFIIGPTGMTITRAADGKFIEANESFLRMFEFNRDEVVGHTSTDLNMWTPDERRKLIQQQLESGGLRDFELVARSKSGRLINLLFSSKPMELKGETCHITTMIDVTERKQAEEALRGERDFSDTVLDSLPGVFYCYDDQFRFLRWNRNFEQVTGYTGEEIACMSPLDFFAGAEKDLLAARIREVFDKGQSEVEADFVSKDGTRTPYYFTGIATWIKGNASLVGVGIDISARKQAEEAFQKLYQDLEKKVSERTTDLTRAVNLMAGRELRIAELKEIIKKLCLQLQEAGLKPRARDPLDQSQ